MGAYSYSGTAASNTTVDGIGAAGSDSPDNIDNLVRALAASDANLVRDLGGANTVAGTDTITVALADASTPSYFDGMRFSFRAAGTNTVTGPTLNVDSLGAKTIKKAVAGAETALVAGDIQSGGMYEVVYRSAWESAAGAFHLLNPNTIPADVSFYKTGSAANLSLGRTDAHGNSVTPGVINFQGTDSAANSQTYGTIGTFVSSNTNGAENSVMQFTAITAGSNVTMNFSGSGLRPAVNDAVALGTNTTSWSDLFLASGGVINWNNGDVTLTHSTDLLTLAGGHFSIGTGGIFTAGTIELGAASDTTLSRSEAGVLAVEGKLVLTQNFATSQASTSGTAIDFTGIPSWVKEIDIMFVEVSGNGTDQLLVQIGDSGGIETSGYLSASGSNASGVGSSNNSTAGFIVRTGAATNVIHGIMSLKNAFGLYWVSSHEFGLSDVAASLHGGGSKVLSSTLDRVRITWTGANSFDAGAINICYR